MIKLTINTRINWRKIVSIKFTKSLAQSQINLKYLKN